MLFSSIAKLKFKQLLSLDKKKVHVYVSLSLWLLKLLFNLSEWLLFNTKWATFQLYHRENK